MHDYYLEKGVPENVALVTAEISDLQVEQGECLGACPRGTSPFDTDFLATVVSTMTYHEFASSDALQELARVVSSGGRLAIADWSADGRGEAGPPLDERFTAEEAVSSLQNHGFKIQHEATRTETFVLVGVRE